MTVASSPASGANAVKTDDDAALKAAEKPADLVTMTVDGITVQVPKGSMIIRAAEQLGIEIPRFCDHPLLDPVGACRQCLVDIATPGPDGSLRKMPKPQVACTTTRTAAVRKCAPTSTPGGPTSSTARSNAWS